MFQTLIAMEPNKDCCIRACCANGQKRAECGWKTGHAEVGQHFSRTNTLVLAPGDKYNTVQSKGRNEVK